MYKVIFIGDNPVFLEVLKSKLDDDFYNVASYKTLSEGIKILENLDVDCVLVSHHLPEGDGHFVSKRLKLDKKFSHIPLIILSSELDINLIFDILEAGADDVAQFDIDMRILVSKIKLMIRLKQSEAELYQLKKVVGIQKTIATYNHEFNNPLAVAIGNLHYLQNSLADTDQLEKAIKIKDSLDKMVMIIRKIRDLKDHVEEDLRKSL